MNLLYELSRAGVLWSIANGTAHTKSGTAYPCMKVNLVMEDGVTFEQSFSLGAYTLAEIIGGVLKKNAPRHPVFIEWLHSQGSEKVRLVEDALENLGEVLHTALRKLADSKQSVITWNALHHLHPSDWTTLLEATRARIVKVTAGDSPRSRAQVGKALRDVVCETVETLEYTEPVVKGRAVKRTDFQKFALRMLGAGCALTETQEWVFGWAGFLVEALPDDDDTEDAAPAAAVQAV